MYNSSEFIELLLSQPIKRENIWCNLYLGISFSLGMAFCIGAGIPLLINSPNSVGIMMLIVGVLISIVFVSLAFLSTIFTRDKAKGIGLAIMIWLYFSILFDGLVLFYYFNFQNTQ
nr:ABC transporter permease subunit [Flavobacterium oreochromis]